MTTSEPRYPPIIEALGVALYVSPYVALVNPPLMLSHERVIITTFHLGLFHLSVESRVIGSHAYFSFFSTDLIELVFGQYFHFNVLCKLTFLNFYHLLLDFFFLNLKV